MLDVLDVMDVMDVLLPRAARPSSQEPFPPGHWGGLGWARAAPGPAGSLGWGWLPSLPPSLPTECEML